MEITFDYDTHPGASLEGRHAFETTPGKFPQIVVPALGATPVDAIQLIKALHLGTVPVAGTGWDVITKHPSYLGQTRLAALIGEIIRLNDTNSRTVLGI